MDRELELVKHLENLNMRLYNISCNIFILSDDCFVMTKERKLIYLNVL